MKTKEISEQSLLLIEDFQLDIDATLPLLIESGYQTANIHISRDLDDAEKFLSKTRPEMIILDLEIPSNDNTIRSQEDDLRRGLSFLRALISKYNRQIHIIVYSRFPFPWVVYQVISQGISFIAKFDYKEFLPVAVKQVRQGHVLVSYSVIPNLRQIFRLALRVGSDKEDIQIIKYVLAGYPDRDIAEKMGFGEDWVAGRLRKMFRAFGFNNRDDLASWFRDYVAPIYEIDLEDG